MTRDVLIRTRGGDDIIFIAPELAVPRTLTIYTGGGSDIVDVYSNSGEGGGIGEDLKVVTGSGNDEVSFFWEDQPGVSAPIFSGPVVVSTGTGDDLVKVFDYHPQGFPGVTFLDRITILTSSGAESVIVSEAIFHDQVKVALGAGNDTLDLGSITVGGSARFLGGAGHGDELVSDMGHTFAVPPKIRGFELP